MSLTCEKCGRQREDLVTTSKRVLRFALFTIPSFAPNYFLLCIYEELGFHTQRDLVTSGSCLFHTKVDTSENVWISILMH